MRLPAGAELFIFEQGQPSTSTRIGGASPLPEGAVQEYRTYVLELRNVTSPDQIELSVDEHPLEALRSPDARTARWRWAPGFHAGVVTLRLQIPGRAHTEFECITDPDLRKLTRSNFDVMVREILEDTHALFALSNFRHGLAKGFGTDVPPLARLEFLRSRIEAVEGTVRAITVKPLRLLRNETVWLEQHRARAITSAELARSFRGGRVVRSDVLPGPPALRGFWPVKVQKSVRTTGYDIPEHRAIKSALRGWAEWMHGVAESLKAVPETDSSYANRVIWAKTCRKLALRLQNLLLLAPFNEVSDSLVYPTPTSVFLRVPAYRRFYALFHEINLGITNVSGDFLNLPLARTFELYELWAFLRVARAAAELYGLERLDATGLFRASSRRDGIVLVSGSPILRITDELAFAFKRNYREYWVEKDKVGSFSRTMQPDVAIRIGRAEERPQRLIVLDAKYRVEDQLNSALASIHMYRDALVEEDLSGDRRRVVAGAYLLTPHQPLSSDDWRKSTVPTRLFHPEYRSEFRFGAVTLRPGSPVSEAVVAVRTILQDSGVEVPTPHGTL